MKKTPANGTISLIYGPAKDGYPIINYEYAIVSNDQQSSSTAKNIRSVLEWAINSKQGSASVLPLSGGLPAASAKVDGAVDQADPGHQVDDHRRRCGGERPRHAAGGGAQQAAAGPAGRLTASAATRKPVWRSAAWVAVLLPLAALVFAITVLALKAWPAVRLNGWYFLYGRTWTYGHGAYAATVTTDGVSTFRVLSSAPGRSSGARWPLRSSPSSLPCPSPLAPPLP